MSEMQLSAKKNSPKNLGVLAFLLSILLVVGAFPPFFLIVYLFNLLPAYLIALLISVALSIADLALTRSIRWSLPALVLSTSVFLYLLVINADHHVVADTIARMIKGMFT